MKTLKAYLVLAASTAALGAPAMASADVLSGNMTADNAFFAYVSTNNATLGTLIGQGNSWPSSFSVASSNLGPGTYYLQVEAINYGGPGALLGSFSVGSQTFSTSLAGWSAVYNNSNSSVVPQNWVTPTDPVQSYGPNDGTTSPWGGPISGISTSADWIDGIGNDSLSACQYCTVDFSYAFTVSGAPGPTPGAGLAGLAALALAGLYSRTRRA